MRSEENALLNAREILRSTTEAVSTLRDSLDTFLPVVAPTVAQAPGILRTVLDARSRAEEPLTHALARLTEARAHLAQAQQALGPYLDLRDKHREAAVEYAAEQIAKRHVGGEKPS